MEQNIIKKLISMLPEGEKRNALVRKLNAAIRRKENNDGGLHDEFTFSPKGHILIEEIDGNGNVVGVLADQPNLVVKGSEEILLRAFSGDPKRTLYKNRKIKEYKDENGNTVKGISKPYSTPLTNLVVVEDGEDIVPHHQNEVWEAVNDSDFEIEYSYYPNTLYVKAEPLPLEPDKVTFRLYDKENAPVGAAPLQAEIYSNYSNLFIGLGDGLNKRIAFSDERLNISNFTEENNTLVSNSIGAKIEFSANITNAVIVASGEGSIKITVDGVEKGTYGLTSNEKVIEITDLDANAKTNVKIEVISGVEIIIKEIAFDEFSIHDNSLMREFEDYTLRFDTPTAYSANTERDSKGTFVIELDHAPITSESLIATYDGAELEKVESIEELVSGKVFVDAKNGRLHLSEPLTSVLVSYTVTGEIHENEPHTALETKTVNVVKKTIEDSGDINLTQHLDGAKTVFDLGFTRIQEPENIVVELDGVIQTKGTHYTIDAENGKLTIIPTIIPEKEAVYDEDGETILTPAVPEQIIIPNSQNTLIVKSFKYEKHTLTALNTYVMQLQHEVQDSQIRIEDQTGKELTFVETEAELLEGCFTIIKDEAGKEKTAVIAKENETLDLITKVEVYYKSSEKPGVETNYARQVIEKPKNKNGGYPWFQLDKGKLVFVAEFPETSPNHNVTIREMGLFDGPRVEDGIRGFKNYNVKAFSLVRVGETRKETTTGLRVTWTITLLNENGEPFKGGL